MPKGTHFHANRDGRLTDKKFRPEDEGIYEIEKQELQGSEQDKKVEAMSEDQFITEQDRKAEG